MRERGDVSGSVNWRRCNYFVWLFIIKILNLYVFSYDSFGDSFYFIFPFVTKYPCCVFVNGWMFFVIFKENQNCNDDMC